MNSKPQKIIMIIAAALASVVALTFIGLAIFKKDFNPKLQTPTRVLVYASTDSPVSYGQGSEEYDKIMRLYNDSFKTSTLDALFQGRISQGPRLVTQTYKNLASLQSSSYVYLEFIYNNPQLITDPSVKYSDKKYVSVVVEVLNTTSLSQVNAYIRYGEAGTNGYSYVRYVTYAAQANLYNYMKELV